MSLSTRLSSSSKGGSTGGLDPIVKDKDSCKRAVASLAKFFEEVNVTCNDFDFNAALKQFKNLPSSRLVREMYNFFFQNILGVNLQPKSSNEIILEHLKTLGYPYAVQKSSIMNPNNSSSWPYNVAILVFLKDLYMTSFFFVTEQDSALIDDEDFDENLNIGEYVKNTSILNKSNKDSLCELKRIVKAMLSADLEFVQLQSEVKELNFVAENLNMDLSEKRQMVEQKFGSFEQFELMFQSVNKAKEQLEDVRDQLEKKDGDKQNASLEFRRMQQSCNQILEQIESQMTLYFSYKAHHLKETLADTRVLTKMEVQSQQQHSQTKSMNMQNCFRRYDELLEELLSDLENNRAQLEVEREMVCGESDEKEEKVAMQQQLYHKLVQDCEVLQARKRELEGSIEQWQSVNDKSRSIRDKDMKEIDGKAKQLQMEADSMVKMAAKVKKEFDAVEQLAADVENWLSI